ncbi:tetratricopeptide repeat protein [Dysgonomonas sp. Marseille-P4677]|uniref:tetratricopeptide repeat protein n=1 Tax=Dysgonomonas sp. Marseille-P4677 TaxID=2364790 RepID=UPI0019112622|nr:tetratricopeptide repeat protein [Dysgonomonas sp. Marseille-P4677]MBK5722415.1 tetratricopeptide repeat protein [Dysgonomonas sp. Marseille-P4677]
MMYVYKKKGESPNYIKTSLAIFLIGLFSCNLVYAQEKSRSDDSPEYIEKVKTLFNHNNWEEGRKVVEEGLEKYPEESDLRMLLGKYYLNYKNYDKARYELSKSLNANPNNIETKQILVNVESLSGRYSSAICYVNELLEVHPYKRALWLKKIELYKLQGNVQEANRLRKRISHIYPEDNQLKDDYIYNAEIDAAEKRKNKNFDGSIALNKELIALQPNNDEFYLNMINDYIKAGDLFGAQNYLDKAINRFPGNIEFINKKVGLLAEQKRYPELLAYLQQEMKANGAGSLRKDYNYYLTEAATYAKNNEAITLYQKIFENNPNNQEAFSYIFNRAISDMQFEEALSVLNRYKKGKGETKELSIKELSLYSRMGNPAKVAALTKKLFAQYPNDSDLKNAYANTMYNEAKDKMIEGNYNDALYCWNMVKQYGDEDMYKMAQNSLYNVYMAIGDYYNAINVLNQVEESGISDPDLYVKRAEVYFKQQQYPLAVDSYEEAINMAAENQKIRYIGGYGDMLTSVIKDLNESYSYDESLKYVERWLKYAPDNSMALHYAVNLSYTTNNIEKMKIFAQQGNKAYPENVYFKIKLAEIESKTQGNYEDVYSSLYIELQKNPYHKDLINAFVQTSENYGQQLIKEKNNKKALSVLNTALFYRPDSKSVKYMKGLAFEGMHQHDSAYYYQSFHEPSALELSDFKQHMNFLKYKGFRNEIGLSYLYSELGDTTKTITISGIAYRRIQNSNTYTAQFYYSGRELGRGIQAQGEWVKNWTTRTYTQINGAWGNKFFPKWSFNASLFNYINFLRGIELELGVGYKRLQEKINLSNAVLGITKDLDLWRINVRFNNYKLEEEWLYNLSTNVRYYLSSPQNYILGFASIGSSPDVELIDYQLYNGFSVANTMVGAGVVHMLSGTVSVSVLGIWNNFRLNDAKFGNLYNIHLNLNVAF